MMPTTRHHVAQDESFSDNRAKPSETGKVSSGAVSVRNGAIKNPDTLGVKHDGGKLRGLSLIPPEAMEALAHVMAYGAVKYAPDSWRGVEVERYVEARERHLLAIRYGETNDPESGLPHDWHVLCNQAFIVAQRFERDKPGQVAPAPASTCTLTRAERAFFSNASTLGATCEPTGKSGRGA